MLCRNFSLILINFISLYMLQKACTITGFLLGFQPMGQIFIIIIVLASMWLKNQIQGGKVNVFPAPPKRKPGNQKLQPAGTSITQI